MKKDKTREKESFLTNVIHYLIALVVNILSLILIIIVMLIPKQNEVLAEKIDKCVVRGMFGR